MALPSAAFALVHDGRLVLEGGSELPAPWWSLTKTALAAATLVLVGRGQLALDAPLAPAPYTLRQLLQHTSGLPDYGGMPAYHEAVARGDAPWSDARLLAAVSGEALRAPPGERFAYSNVGYLRLRRMLEDATGCTLDEALRTLVFGPLGLPGVRIASAPADLDSTAWGNARAYHPGWVYHGLAVGTAAEAALFLSRLLGGDLFLSRLFGSKELGEALRDAMMQSFPVHDGPLPRRPWTKPGYGLGVMVDLAMPLGACYGHTGGGPGSTCASYCLPHADPPRTAAVLSRHEAAATEHAACDLLRGNSHPSM